MNPIDQTIPTPRTDAETWTKGQPVVATYHARQLERELVTLQRELEAKRWQLIETAPRDKRVLLADYKTFNPASPYQIKIGYRSEIAVTRLSRYWMIFKRLAMMPSSSSHDGVWRDDSGFYFNTATHWMPLPECPV